MDVSQLRNKKISIIGAARSGIAVAQLLRHFGAAVFVSDKESAEKLSESVAELRAAGITYETGNHSERVFDSSWVVLSPGVPSGAPVVLEARRRRIHIVSELEVASWFCKAPIVAITGSNGKTTTTTLLGRMFSDAKKKHVVAGNIGTAFSSVVLDVDEETVAVLEVSSFQLDFIESFHPNVAVMLNITRNHLDRYNNSMELYASSKARIFMNQTSEDTLIVNADDMWSRKKIEGAKGNILYFSTHKKSSRGAYVGDGVLTTRISGTEFPIVSERELSLKGEHNLQNAMAATLAAQFMGVNPASIRSTLRNFKGVEHRQEFVREVNGVSFVNDSKATTVDAVKYALSAFDEPIVLILGGKDKGNDYSKIVELVKKKVRAIVATGASAGIVEKAFAGTVPVHRIETIGNEKPNIVSMRETIQTAAALARQGDVVLLSPACTSFDWFKDYEERGNIFKQLVHQL
ncbi:MAG: UDP-N-acetylmuramoyl-L-alanine--D-glutamate ligase [Bacteroidota bacterium]|nr:UDP-N-acetylmuramoyl-L-alanine--D-glutamate ligase [Bacteroidota bacterium]